MAFVPHKDAHVEVTEATPDRMIVSGELTFETATAAYEDGLRIIAAAHSRETLQIDCADVTDSDSAGLAVLIEWLAAANRIGRKTKFANLPPGIRAAANISDVEFLLSLCSEGPCEGQGQNEEQNTTRNEGQSVQTKSA